MQFDELDFKLFASKVRTLAIHPPSPDGLTGEVRFQFKFLEVDLTRRASEVRT